MLLRIFISKDPFKLLFSIKKGIILYRKINRMSTKVLTKSSFLKLLILAYTKKIDKLLAMFIKIQIKNKSFAKNISNLQKAGEKVYYFRKSLMKKKKNYRHRVCWYISMDVYQAISIWFLFLKYIFCQLLTKRNF